MFDAATRDLVALLEPFTNSGDFLPEVKKLDASQLPDCNAAVLLYDFRYTGGIPKAEHEGVSLRFLGCFSCELG